MPCFRVIVHRPKGCASRRIAMSLRRAPAMLSPAHPALPDQDALMAWCHAILSATLPLALCHALPLLYIRRTIRLMYGSPLRLTASWMSLLYMRRTIRLLYGSPQRHLGRGKAVGIVGRLYVIAPRCPMPRKNAAR